MPRYLIIHAERRGDDTVIEDPNLTVEFTDGWVLFIDHSPPSTGDRVLFGEPRVALAIPAVQVLRVERVDEPQEPQDQEPAPAKE
ncbi:hypothetical protein [Streptomyces sp. NPDC001652]|uniref:hypothetical protein n=1 Tax=Streptomyces sp. NPDC001652 TaxID=3154393 RepID=UPI00331F48F7